MGVYVRSDFGSYRATRARAALEDGSFECWGALCMECNGGNIYLASSIDSYWLRVKYDRLTSLRHRQGKASAALVYLYYTTGLPLGMSL